MMQAEQMDMFAPAVRKRPELTGEEIHNVRVAFLRLFLDGVGTIGDVPEARRMPDGGVSVTDAGGRLVSVYRARDPYVWRVTVADGHDGVKVVTAPSATVRPAMGLAFAMVVTARQLAAEEG